MGSYSRWFLKIPFLLALVSLAGTSAATAATLKVSSFPSGAQVLVDGLNTGKLTPMNISLAEGDHVVTVQIPGSGWNADTRTITIVSGNNDLSVTLLPTIRADGPCFDNVNRYVDCGNGTVTDSVTGLIWLQRADCLGSASWVDAHAAAAHLAAGQCGLTDGSSAGDWRLPTESEWRATINAAAGSGCTGNLSPSLTDNAGTGCLAAGQSSFVGSLFVLRGTFWGGTTFEGFPSCAASALLADGLVGCLGARTALSLRVWAVRSSR